MPNSLLADRPNVRRVMDAVSNFAFNSNLATGTSPDWHTKTAAHWLEVCRNCAVKPGQVKVAELGGGQDTPFEQAFSNLAHAYLKDKAPKLLDFEVGFQLLEKNQDNTKAVGVFGFKVGNQWIYCPVFFLNGDLKGHELMYIKSQDMFVPLQEEWVDHLLGKKPSVLGDGVNRNLSLLGIMPPNLYQLSRSPQKFASAPAAPPPVKMASWCQDFMPTLGYLATTPIDQIDRYKTIKSFPDFLKESGDEAFRFFLEKIGSEYPTLFKAVEQIYGYDALVDVARDIVRQKEAAQSRSLVKDAVVSAAGDPLPKGWNGTMQRPSKRNGGVRSNGIEAWEKSQEGRRFENRHGGAQQGRIGESGARMYDADHEKDANYPGCGMRKKKRRMRKRASIIPSLIGPIEALPEGIKHKVVSKEMVDLDPDVVHDLTADEKATLLRERVIFKDTRDKKDVTIAYDVQTPLKLRNPDNTGIYYVLVKPDRFEKCLVVMGPYSHRRRENYCTVVRLDGKKDYVNTHPANVWVRSEYDLDAWKKWLKEQKDADSIPLQRKKSYSDDGESYPDYRDRRCFMILGPTGEGTAPFRAQEKYEGGGDKAVIYDVEFECHSSGSRPGYLPDHGSEHDDPIYGRHSDGEHLLLTKLPGVKITLRPGYCIVPDGFKLISVRDEEDMNGPEVEPLRLGALIDAQMAVMANTMPLTVVSDGKDVSVNENRMDKTSAVIHLFADHGLSKEAAEAIVDKALLLKHVEARVVYPDYIKACWTLEKEAVDPGNDMIRGAPNAPPFPEPYMGYDPMSGGNVPTMQQSEFNIAIPDMSAAKTDRSIFYPMGPDPRSMQVAQQAATTGQKEVMDTAMLGSMLKTVSQENMVDRYMGDLMKGLDRLGRILFLYYWHGEEFEDRYGKQDMPEIEDSLRNVFEGSGDLILRLKRKTIDPYMDDSGQIDLGPVANT